MFICCGIIIEIRVSIRDESCTCVAMVVTYSNWNIDFKSDDEKVNFYRYMEG